MTDPLNDSRFNDLRILIVEDEAEVALQLEDMLGDLGCIVVGPASRISQALALLDRHAIDTAILDLNVAGELVYPVADRLADRGIPFVFTTGYGVGVLGGAYRARPVLEKPFALSRLGKALLESLG